MKTWGYSVNDTSQMQVERAVAKTFFFGLWIMFIAMWAIVVVVYKIWENCHDPVGIEKLFRKNLCL